MNKAWAIFEDDISITPEILKSNGFEDITSVHEREYYNSTYGITDYCSFRKWTDEGHSSIKLDISHRVTNNNAEWNLHIDNCDCDTIGSMDIDYVWQFNALMTILGSNFRLNKA